MKNSGRTILFVCGIIACLNLVVKGQTVSPVVVNSNGSFYAASWGDFSYSVGEPVTLTISNTSVLTQGFLQPRSDSTLLNALVISATGHSASCRGGGNGYGTVAIISGKPPYVFSWSPAGGTNDTTSPLPPGIYTVTVKDNSNAVASDTVHILDGSITCTTQPPAKPPFKIYSGFTPNEDNFNDLWLIDGINDFPENTVTLYNRWGNKVWEGTGYNNASVVWKGTDTNGNRLTDGTYFYIVTTKEQLYKGWVELTR